MRSLRAGGQGARPGSPVSASRSGSLARRAAADGEPGRRRPTTAPAVMARARRRWAARRPSASSHSAIGVGVGGAASTVGAIGAAVPDLRRRPAGACDAAPVHPGPASPRPAPRSPRCPERRVRGGAGAAPCAHRGPLRRRARVGRPAHAGRARAAARRLRGLAHAGGAPAPRAARTAGSSRCPAACATSCGSLPGPRAGDPAWPPTTTRRTSPGSSAPTTARAAWPRCSRWRGRCVAPAARACQRRVRFVMLDGEESPGPGDDGDFARTRPARQPRRRGAHRGPRIHRAIVVDFVADARPLAAARGALGPRAVGAAARRRRRGSAWRACSRPGWRPAVLDDHLPYRQRGVPAIDLIDFDYPPLAHGRRRPGPGLAPEPRRRGGGARRDAARHAPGDLPRRMTRPPRRLPAARATARPAAGRPPAAAPPEEPSRGAPRRSISVRCERPGRLRRDRARAAPRAAEARGCGPCG